MREYHGGAVLALAAAIVAFMPAAASADPDLVRIGTDVDARTLDARLQRDTTAYRIVNMVYDGLVQLDKNLQPTPNLATSWENPDPTTWIFHLREDAQFHDGTPVTAEDVKYTLDTIRDPELKARFRSLYTPIESVDVVDAHTAQINLVAPYAPLLNYLDLGIVPKHLGEAGADLSNEPVGSGPYKFVEWEKGAKIVLEANSDFWGGEPEVGRVEWIVVPDNTARAQALESEDLDLIMSPLSPQDIQRLTGDDRYANGLMTGIAITYFNFNTAKPHMADPRVRQALGMLIDQESIVGGIFEGTDEMAQSILLPSWPAFDENVKQPSFDPDAALALLAEVGYADSDGDGVLDRDGENLVIDLQTHSEDPNRVQTIEFVENVLNQFGVGTSVRISDWPSFTARRDVGDYDLILLGWTLLSDPDRVTYTQLRTDGGNNWGGYSNPRLDELLDTGRAEVDLEKRNTIYREAAQIIADEVPYYILSYQGYHAFYNPEIDNLQVDPRGMVRSIAGLN